MIKYAIIMLCHDDINEEEDNWYTDCNNRLYDTLEQAKAKVKKQVNDEMESLANDDDYFYAVDDSNLDEYHEVQIDGSKDGVLYDTLITRYTIKEVEV